MALEQYRDELGHTREIPYSVLQQLTTIFNKCKIAAMIANNNYVGPPLNTNESDYDLPMGDDQGKRNETEEGCLDSDTPRAETKNIRIAVITSAANPAEQGDNYLEKIALAGDNDLPSDSRDQLNVSVNKIDVELERNIVPGKVHEIKEKATDTTDHQAKPVQDRGETLTAAPSASAKDTKEKKLRSNCMCACS